MLKTRRPDSGQARRNNSGQAVLSEYVMIFFVVIAAGVAMSTFLQRSLEARINDARNYAVNAVAGNAEVCDSNCLAAAGGQIGREYEPYYVQSTALVNHAENNTSTLQADMYRNSDGAWQGGSSGIYRKNINEQTTMDSFGYQAPPKDAK